MSITDQLEDERRIINAATAGPWETVTRRYSSDIGWYDASHIPGVVEDIPPSCDVEESAPLEPADANFIAHARTALPLRNAQVAAVLAAVAEAEAHVQRMRGFGGTNAFLSGMEEMNRTIRRAIEEAGA